MLYFITATPGAGKTLYIINKLKDIKDRQIFYHGIPELKLPWIELQDPLNYPNEVTDGSIVVIDEVTDHFPPRAPKDKPPLGVEFLRKHRHRGIDIYFITQHPTLLDHAARRMVEYHIHLQRNYGLQRAVMYENTKLFDPSNWHDLQSCEKTDFKYPKDCYPLYKSAEVHTVKRKLPKKLFYIIPLLLLFLGSLVYGYSVISTMSATGTESTPDLSAPLSNGFSLPSNISNTSKNKINWETDLIPQIAGLPYTAPIYQSIAKPTEMPIIAGCISQNRLCTCYTQQGTAVNISTPQCFEHIQNPAFNPFKKQKKETQLRQVNNRNRRNNQSNRG